MILFCSFVLSLFPVFVGSIDINDTTTYVINTNGEAKFSLDVGADGIEFIFVKASLLYFTGVANLAGAGQKIRMKLTFHDDDYHNTPFYMSTNNVDITFDCDDPIVFSLRYINSEKTVFGATKKISSLHITQSQDCTFDYESFVSGFGAGGVFADTMYSDFHSELQILLPTDQVSEITFSDVAFYVELKNGEKDSFSKVNLLNFDIILISKDDELQIDSSSSSILGNVTVSCEKGIINATEKFKQVTSSKSAIRVCCEIILLPYDSLPDGIFSFVDSSYSPKTDQIIMTNGVRRYCLYDDKDKKCHVIGTVPLYYDSSLFGLNVHSGKSMTYVICTQNPPTINLKDSSAPSLAIIGTDTQRQVSVNMMESTTSLSDHFELSNIEIAAFASMGVDISLKSIFIGENVKLSGNNWKNVHFQVSELYNSSFDFYLTNVIDSTSIFAIEFLNEAKVSLYEFNNIENLVLTEDELKICYGTSSDKCVKFNTNMNNRVIIYTTDLLFNLDPAGAKMIYGNFEIHIKTKIGDTALINFFEDWANVVEVINGPIGIYVEQGHNHHMTIPYEHFPAGFVDYSRDQFTLYSTTNTTICLYKEGEQKCDPGVLGGKAEKIPSSGEVQIASGTKYTYVLPSNSPQNLHFTFGKTSVRSIGFVGTNNKEVMKITISDHWINEFSIEKVKVTAVISEALIIANYTNHDATLEFSTPNLMVVNTSISIDVDEYLDFASHTDMYIFSGVIFNLIDKEKDISEVEFLENNKWSFNTNSGKKFSIGNENKIALSVESGSQNVVFNIAKNAKTLKNMEFKSTGNTIWYFNPIWTDSSISIDSPIKLRFTTEANAKLYHPFAYIDEKAKQILDIQHLAEDCPYQNASVCLSQDGTASCGLSGFYLPVKYENNEYKVPSGYRFDILLNIDGAKISFDSTSAKNVSITGFGKEKSVSIAVANQPADLLLLLKSLSATLDSTQSSIEWKLGSLELFDVSLASSKSTTKTTISGNCSIEMDIFMKLTTGKDAIFGEGKLIVENYLLLRDSNEEYLKEIQVGTNQWTLVTSVGSFKVSMTEYSHLIFGVNRPPTANPQFIPLTVDTLSIIDQKIKGNVNIDIEEENLYLTVGSDWSKIKGVTDKKIKIRATHGKGIARVFYDSKAILDPTVLFEFEKSTVHYADNNTCPICLLPSEGFVGQCFGNRNMDMYPIVESNLKNYKISENNRTFVVYGDSSTSEPFDFQFDTNVVTSVGIIAAYKMTVKMSNIPSTIDLYFDSLIDDDGETELLFEKSMSLKSLKFDDSVRITVNTQLVKDFKLTLDTFLQLDYKSFRRFFREPGVFWQKDSIVINGELNIVDDGRYELIELGKDKWKLTGNLDSWNTTLIQRGNKQTLKLTTVTKNVHVSVLEENESSSSQDEVLPVSFVFKMSNSAVYFEPSICDLSSFTSNSKCSIDAFYDASIYSSFAKLPDNMFSYSASKVTSKYIEPTNEIALCLYTGSTPCSISGTKPLKVDFSGSELKNIKIKCAKSITYVLTNSLTKDNAVPLSFEQGSSMSVSLKTESDIVDLNNVKKVTFSMKEEESVSLSNLELSSKNVEINLLRSDNAELSFRNMNTINSRVVNIEKKVIHISNTLTTDYLSFEDLNEVIIKVDKSLKLSGKNLPTSNGGPKFVLAQQNNAKIDIKEFGHFSKFEFGDNSISAQIPSTSTKWKFANIEDSATTSDDSISAVFADDKKAVSLSWIGDMNSNQNIPKIKLQFEKSGELKIERGGTSNWPNNIENNKHIKIIGQELSLIVSTSPAPLFEISNTKVTVNYETLKNIKEQLNKQEISPFVNSQLFVNTLNDDGTGQPIDQIRLDNGLTQIGQDKDDVKIDRVNSVKGDNLIISHKSDNFVLNLSLFEKSSSDRISDITVKIDKDDTKLRLKKGFASDIKSGQISIENPNKHRAVIYITGDKIPSILDYNKDDDNIKIIFEEDDGSGNQKMSTATIIVIVVFAIVGAAAVGVLVYYFVFRKRGIQDITDYDYAPPLLSRDERQSKLETL